MSAKPQTLWNRDLPIYTDRHLIALANRLAFHIRLIDWMRSRRRPPTRDELVDYLGCSRASAYRYIAAWRIVTGTEP